MTLATLTFLYMGGLLASFTGASVLVVWALNISNRYLADGNICVHQYDVMRVQDLMFYFRSAQYMVVLVTMVLSGVLVFGYQMQLPHARPFLLLMWCMSLVVCLMCYAVLKAFLLYDERADEDPKHDGEQKNEEIPPQ